MIKEMEDELEIKRTVKWQRKSIDDMGSVLPITPIDSIPIEVKDKSEYIHYPAGPEDIVNLLKILPQGVADGISKISLCLGNSYELERDDFWADKCEPEIDPFTKREGSRVFSEVYMSNVLGTYFLKKSEIRLYGYVYSPELENRKMWEVYFRLKMLMTFAHELSHHYDFSYRIARGRWRFDNNQKVESYADETQFKWAREYIIPYLEKTYPQDVKQLKKWMEENIGFVCPLELLAGDPYVTNKDGAMWISTLFSTSSAFEEFVDAILKGKNRDEARLEFGNNIHMAEGYDMALSIIDELLNRKPEWAKALILKADICVHKEEYDKAIALTNEALESEANSIRALEVMADGYYGSKQWQDVISLSERIMNLCGEDEKYQYAYALEMGALANLELENYDLVEQAINELMKGHRGMKRIAERLSGKYKERLESHSQ